MSKQSFDWCSCFQWVVCEATRDSCLGLFSMCFSSAPEGKRMIVKEWLRIRPSWAKVNLRRILGVIRSFREALADLFLPLKPSRSPPSVWKRLQDDILLKLYWLWLWWLPAFTWGGVRGHPRRFQGAPVFQDLLSGLRQRIVRGGFQEHQSSKIFCLVFSRGGNKIELGPRTSVSILR